MSIRSTGAVRSWEEAKRTCQGPTDKPFAIPKPMVWEAWRRVKANKGAPGVDGQALEEFEADLEDNLYKIWNRMSSGSYFPPPVRAVEIPKPHGGGVRMLGVPTIADRVAQTVVAMHAGAAGGTDRFHPDSYGYRPGRSAHDAVAACRQRCWKYDWVIDLDVQKFFDAVPWDLVVKAVEASHRRAALGAAVCQAVAGGPAAASRTAPWSSGTGEPRKGRRSRRSWRTCSCTTRSTRGWPGSSRRCPFERYADDAVVHCATERQAEQVLAAIAARMDEVGLRLHPDKTRIVYCKDGRRRAQHEHTSFTFLGYAFRPREARSKDGRSFHRLPARDQPRGAQGQDGRRAPRMADPPAHRPDLDDLARWLNPIVAGLDQLLRPVLPVGAVSPPAAHQHLPEALGWQEVQAAADLQAVHSAWWSGLLDRDSPACSPTGAWVRTF